MNCQCCGSNNVRTYYDYVRPDVIAWIHCGACDRHSPKLAFDMSVPEDVIDEAIMGEWQAVTLSKQPAAAQR